MELRDDSNSCFLADGLLKELINESTVTTFLEQHRENFGMDTDTSKLAAFVCQRARRAFAILIWTDRANYIEQFFKSGFTDEMLPVQVKNRDDEDWVVESLNITFTDSKAVSATFSSWQDIKIDSFCDYGQWPFLAPVFRGDQFRYAFHERSRLPFINSRDQKETMFSFIDEWEIHPDHLTGSTIVRRCSQLLEDFRAAFMKDCSES